MHCEACTECPLGGLFAALNMTANPLRLIDCFRRALRGAAPRKLHRHHARENDGRIAAGVNQIADIPVLRNLSGRDRSGMREFDPSRSCPCRKPHPAGERPRIGRCCWHEGSMQADWLDGCRSVAVAGCARGRNLDATAADKRSAAGGSKETRLQRFNEGFAPSRKPQ